MVTSVNETPAVSTLPPTVRSRRRRRVVSTVTAGGLLSTYLSIIVILPVVATIATGVGASPDTTSGSWWPGDWVWHSNFSAFVDAIGAPAAWHAIWLSVWLSLLAASVNTVMGALIAWVLVRDRFRGQKFIESFVDIPFALPTIVAGVVFIYLYGPASPVHVNLFEAWTGLFVALLFVSLPFSVRTIQPVLVAMDRDVEHAARTLGASPWRVTRSVIIPSLVSPALAGFGLAFARCVGEFGSISLIGGGIARTTTASTYIYNLTQGFLWQGAAAVSTILLLISVTVLTGATWFAASFHDRRAL